DNELNLTLTNIAADNPDLVYLPLFSHAGGLVPLQARKLAVLTTTKMMGSDGLFTSELLNIGGDSAVGMYLTAPDLSSFGAQYADLSQAFADKYGQAPQAAYHAFAYDAVGIIFQAISAVAQAETNGTLHIGRQALRTALFATANFPGVTGTLTCS